MPAPKITPNPPDGSPTIGTPSYELAVNGDEHLLRAQFDVQTWAARVYFAATSTQGGAG